MEILKFKTNINCGGCINGVTPTLNNTPGIKNWEVDINNPDKILTVETDGIGTEEVIQAVTKAGYKITPL